MRNKFVARVSSSFYSLCIRGDAATFTLPSIHLYEATYYCLHFSNMMCIVCFPENFLNLLPCARVFPIRLRAAWFYSFFGFFLIFPTVIPVSGAKPTPSHTNLSNLDGERFACLCWKCNCRSAGRIWGEQNR